jgi:hypothetical protein
LSYWDVSSNAWLIAAGVYTVYLGDSSSGARLTAAGTVQIGS